MTNRILGTCMALTSVLLSFWGQEGAANLLTNPGFENVTATPTPGIAEGWSPSWDPNQAGWIVTATAKCSGIYGLWSYTDGGTTEPSYSKAYQETPAAPGDVFVGSADIRIPSASDWTSGSYACVRLSFFSAGGTLLASYDTEHMTDPTGGCASVSVTTEPAPVNANTVRFACYLYEPAAAIGDLSVANFDNCSLTKPDKALAIEPPVLGFGCDLTSSDFTVGSANAGVVNWSATPNETWITVQPSSGATSSTAPVSVTVDRTQLCGTATYPCHEGTITVTSDGGSATVKLFVESDLGLPVPTLPSLVRVDPSNARRLLVQKRRTDGGLEAERPSVIRGVCWSPVGVGTGADYPARRAAFSDWHRLDIQLMRRMNVNVIFLFIDLGTDVSLIGPARQILDYCYENGVMVIMNVDEECDNKANIPLVVGAFKDHPAILMWSLGNEWTITRPDRPFYYCKYATIEEAAAEMEKNAQTVKGLDANHPVASIMGDITSPSLSKIGEVVNTLCPTVDVWGSNVYRGPDFGALFTEWASMSSEPLFVSEFGTDAFFTEWPDAAGGPEGYENPAKQADYLSSQWQDIRAELSAADPSKVCLGGAIFEWNDEWWKGGNPSNQDNGGWASGSFPDGFGNEEWWGIVDIARRTREAYDRLKDEFAMTEPVATPTAVPTCTATPTPTIGWAVATSDRPVSGLLLYGDKDPSAKDMAGLPATTSASDRNVLAHFASDATRWYTGISLANPNGLQASVSIEAYNGSGEFQGSKVVPLPPMGKTSRLVSALFPEGLTGTGWFDVTSDLPIVAFDLYGDMISGGIAAIPSSPVENDLVLSHFIHSNRWWTGVVVLNPSENSTDVTLTAYKADGTKLDANPFSVAARSKKSGMVEGLLPATANQTGWIRVESTPQKVAALLVYGDKQVTPNRIAALNGTTSSTSLLLSNFFSEAEKWWTGVAIVNPSETLTATVALKAYAPDGTLIWETNPSIGSLEKKLGLMSALFSLGGQTEGWVEGISDNPIVGLEVISGDDAIRQAWGLAGIESQTAGSTLYFPHSVVSARWWTLFALANPDNLNAANVILDGYGNAGDLVDSANLTIPSNGRIAELVEDLF